jgi:hypothetical protein
MERDPKSSTKHPQPLVISLFIRRPKFCQKEGERNRSLEPFKGSDEQQKHWHKKGDGEVEG